jgi:L-arabinose isomerase
MGRQKLRVGFVGVSIGTYYAGEYKTRDRAIEGLEKLAESQGFDLIAVRDEVMDADMAGQAADFLRTQDIDFLIIHLSAVSMGDQLLKLLNVAPRIGLWAIPDPQFEGEIKIHSLVAMSQYASIIKRYLKHEEIPFKWFYGEVDSETFRSRFDVTVRALTAVVRIENARIGWVGGLSDGFHDMIFDERVVKNRLGVSVFSHEASELVMRAKTYDFGLVSEKVAEIKAVATEIRVAEDTAFDRTTRFYLALRDLAEEMEYDALAVQCWPKLQALYNIAPCMAYSWLGSEDGFPVSCEGDVPGAISMLLLNTLTKAPGSSTLLDFTAIDPKTRSVLMWHCGVSPRHFANEDGIKWVDHVTLGRKQDDGPYGIAGDQVFAPQDTTVSYVGDDGSSLLVLSAPIIEHPEKGFDGTRGWFAGFELNKEPIELWDLINTLTVRGHEHHYAVGQGDVTSELLEFAAWKKMRLIERVPYVDYLQLEGVNI